MAEQDGGSLVYQVDIDTAKMITGSRQASVVLGEMEKQSARSSKAVDGLTSSADSAGRSMSGFKTVLSGVASAISVALIIDYGKAFLTVADNITQLQSRILRLSTDAATAMSTFETLTAIASTTGASLRDTAKLWEAMTSALKGTGATNTQILALTDTLQKIGRVGGSSTDEMANALRQFGQSISSGTVRAEEFNSILEQMPELARQIGAGMGLSMGQLRQAMLEGKLSAQDALNAIMKQSSAVNDEFSKLPRTMDQASNSLTISLQNLIGKMNEAMGASATMVKVIDSISAAIDRLSGKTETASQKIADLTSTGEMYARRARTWSWLGLDGWSEQNQALAALSNKAATLIGDMNSVAKASENAANGTINFNNSGTANPKQDALVKRSQRRIELSKLEGEAKARLQALYDAEDAGIPKNDPRVKTLQDQYAEIERNTKAQKESNAEGKKSASQAESVAQKLANLKQQSELAADSASELNREQAILNAQLSLGKGATQAQIAEAGAYAAKKWDTANAIKAQAAAEKLLPEPKENASYAQDVKDLNTALAAKKISQEQYNTTAEQLEQQHQVNLAKIRAEAVVSPQQQAVGMVDPVQQLANENAQKLALIQQFENDGTLAHDQALALRTAADRQYEQQRTEAQWQLLSQQSLGYDMLTSAVDAFSGNASNAITGLLTGTMSAQEAMRSLGNTILNSVINSIVQVGVEALKNYILGQTLGAASVASSVGMAATTASAWAPAAAMASLATLGANAVPAAAGITSTVGLAGGLALAGARYNGGPVSAGAMYQVGERGKPEIYQASTGKQYMIPGDNGKVISNKQITGGGSAAPTIIIENYSSGAGVMDTQASKGADGADVVRIVLADLQQGGQISQGISQYHQAPRKATE
ncbi:tape measure protein [Serratia marcescens]|uniref:tape measure protein n=1 Tax=Serratia marcescens TaxID=615 RepID=UPI0007451938|nr:tape measure protein [Serratia marcescens]CUY33511.1 Phage-related minor tail protein [Serratia marcescens]CVD35019.1 Phage-related minor tail protein [Serratia marcescens]CVD66489.1 Phage-related minor tail protein [Serratia marcescens]CVE23831.1 Phage-related minor tail protein [Serratia marcescens]CVE77265.1 Phage-related minor tail protein [Serratia marcescens]